MFKTPIRAKFVSRLEKINDQLCYTAFARHELDIVLTSHAAASADKFTTAVFPANPYADRIFRKLKDLPAFGAASKEIELQMVVIAAVEHALAYASEIESFRRLTSPTATDDIAIEAAEDQLFEKVSQWAGSTPPRGDFRTLGYLRLLRNHYAHVNDVPSSAFSAYIATHAHHLQRFWNNGVTQLAGLRFKTLPDAPLTSEIAFAIMNLVRVVIEHIDFVFASTLQLDRVVFQIAAELLDTVKGHDRSAARLAPKVRFVLEHGYGVKQDTAQIQPLVESFLETRRSD